MEKPFRTIDEQIDILRSRGMIIDVIETARKALEKISYYRLSGYSYPFRQYDKGLIGQVVLVFGLSFVATKPKGGGWTRCDLSSWLARSCWFYPGF